MNKFVELSGSASFNDSFDPLYLHRANRLVYNVGDPLVLPSTWHFEGLARFSVHPNIAVGAHGSVDLFQTANFLHLPFDDTPVWGLGPNVAFHFHPGSEDFTLGLSAALTITSIPWTTWTLTNPSSAPWRTLAFDPSLYYRQRSSTDILFLYRVSFGASYIFVEHLEPFGGISLQNAIRNTGFDNYDYGRSTLQATDLNLVPYLGLGVRFEPIFARAQFYLPLNVVGQRHGDFGTQLQFGVEF
jgi:hypothetical protein